MIDSDNRITVGSEVVVVLLPEATRPEKVRRAVVLEATIDPLGVLVVIVDVASAKTPGSYYRTAVRPDQILGLYEGEESLEALRLKRGVPAAARPLSTFTAYANVVPSDWVN